MRTVLKASRIGAAAALILAVVLIGRSCLALYAAGVAPSDTDENGLLFRPVYSRETVALRLSSLAVPLSGCAGILVLACFLNAWAGGDRTGRFSMTPENRLRLMKARIGELPEAARQEERRRRGLTRTGGVCLALTGAYCLSLLLDAQAFPPWTAVSPDAAIGALLRRLTLPAAIALLLSVAVSYARKASVEREIMLLKDAPKTVPAPAQPVPSGMTAVRILLYALAAAFIVLGVMNGGLRDVLYKAINICTECIGLG